jgi:hypothetical protein
MLTALLIVTSNKGFYETAAFKRLGSLVRLAGAKK